MPDVTAYRPVADELAQLRTEVRMLRSAHDDLACSRQNDRRCLQELVKRLLTAAATDSLPAPGRDGDLAAAQQRGDH